MDDGAKVGSKVGLNVGLLVMIWAKGSYDNDVNYINSKIKQFCSINKNAKYSGNTAFSTR